VPHACILKKVGFVLFFTVFGEDPAFAKAAEKPASSVSEGLGTHPKNERKSIEQR